MPEYLSPGVYVEEIDAGPRPIASVATSIAGMVGVTARGPVSGKPVLVTSYLDYRQTFGGAVPEPPPGIRDAWQNQGNPEGGRWWLFPLAVRGFFDNGGRQLFVKRVVASGPNGAKEATTTLEGGILADVGTAAATATRLTLEHLVGVQNTTQLTIRYRDGGAPATQVVAVTGYDARNRTVDIAAPGLTREVRAGQAIVQIGALDANPTLTVTASAPGTWGDGVRVRVRPTVTTFSLLADPAEGLPFATALAAPSAAGSPTVDVAQVPGLEIGPPIVPPTPFFVQIGPGRFGVNNVGAGPGNAARLTLTGANVAGHLAWNPPLAVRRVRRARAAGAGTTIRVAGAGGLYPGAVVELDNGTAKETVRVAQVQGDVVTFASALANEYFETDKLHLIELSITASYADQDGEPLEETVGPAHPGLTVPPDPLALDGRANGRARLVTVTQRADITTTLRLPVPSAAALAAGGPTATLAASDDAYGALAPRDFQGEDRGSGRRTGIESLVDIDQVAICAVPGMWSGSVQASLVQHCEELKDRFAILDPPDDLDTQGVLEFRNGIITRYAALYHPWLRTRDQATDTLVRVPPSGHMAGVYARVDIERGVHKAPANVIVRGIVPREGLGQDVTKRQQDLLNPTGVNALRAFPELGQRVWGARTLAAVSDSTWRYINVRRLFIMIEESIDEGTQWVVFEPNDEPLWALVRQSVENYLTTVWRTGALAGTTPDDAFFVACDRTTMTQDDIDQGRLICRIGVAPVFPAEFVIFRVQQKTREPATV